MLKLITSIKNIITEQHNYGCLTENIKDYFSKKTKNCTDFILNDFYEGDSRRFIFNKNVDFLIEINQQGRFDTADIHDENVHNLVKEIRDCGFIGSNEFILDEIEEELSYQMMTTKIVNNMDVLKIDIHKEDTLFMKTVNEFKIIEKHSSTIRKITNNYLSRTYVIKDGNDFQIVDNNMLLMIAIEGDSAYCGNFFIRRINNSIGFDLKYPYKIFYIIEDVIKNIFGVTKVIQADYRDKDIGSYSKKINSYDYLKKHFNYEKI